MRHRVPGAAVAVILTALAGCAANGGSHPVPKVADPVLQEHPPAETRSIAPLLEMMTTLPQSDPARQAETFEAAKQAVSMAPTTSNKLRFALALATPGHGASDPVAAQRQLSQLLATPENLLPVERLLALVELQQVNHRLILQAENRQLREEAPRESRDKLQAVNRRLAAESDENARLRKALDDAMAKLEAVTHIERSINDRAASGAPTP